MMYQLNSLRNPQSLECMLLKRIKLCVTECVQHWILLFKIFISCQNIRCQSLGKNRGDMSSNCSYPFINRIVMKEKVAMSNDIFNLILFKIVLFFI